MPAVLPPGTARQKRLLTSVVIDSLGSGLFIPFSLLFFTATTSLSLPRIGLALSIAAVVRFPATLAAGWFSDRVGARRAVVVSQLLQAVGFANYLFVDGIGHLVAAAVVVQIGNSIFWVAYQALVSEVATGDTREQWFALATAVRTAGWAVGGVISGVVVATGGTTGYRAVVVANAVSFAVAAALMWRPLPRAADASMPVDDPSAATASAWGAVMRDRPFLGFVAVNLGFTLLSLCFTAGLPVYLVRTAGLPTWAPGAVLAINAVLGTFAAPLIVRRIAGRARRTVLVASQAMIAVGFAAALTIVGVPVAVGLLLAVVAVVLVAGCEVMQGAVVPAVVTEAATPRTIGRYMSVYQLTFAAGDVLAPGLITMALHHGAAALWLPLIVIAVIDAVLVAVLTRALSPLRRAVGAPVTDTRAERIVEADGL